ncbi:hypothetical protein F2P81_009678 [Scophthalmus maximus]|nr:hypothetical protein F2P81_009678 [Scophthalmus maximus]
MTNRHEGDCGPSPGTECTSTDLRQELALLLTSTPATPRSQTRDPDTTWINVAGTTSPPSWCQHGDLVSLTSVDQVDRLHWTHLLPSPTLTWTRLVNVVRRLCVLDCG